MKHSEHIVLSFFRNRNIEAINDFFLKSLFSKNMSIVFFLSFIFIENQFNK